MALGRSAWVAILLGIGSIIYSVLFGRPPHMSGAADDLVATVIFGFSGSLVALWIWGRE